MGGIGHGKRLSWQEGRGQGDNLLLSSPISSSKSPLHPKPYTLNPTP
ncbi:MAG: hypothetical protein F6J93_33165 [Oscillatoria sp. SIO1A7]|nr:hypothetical protein [Oscillatoria sp. SIO1A7]